MANNAKRATDSDEKAAPAMTEQQRLYTSGGKNPLLAYKHLTVGDTGWGAFILSELYTITFAALPGLLGFGARSFCLPFLLANRPKGLRIGRSVTIRQPGALSIAGNAVLDDFVTLDIRKSKEGAKPEINLGSHVTIGRFSSIVSKNAVITLGNGCNISSHCRIASESKLTIGNSVLIAAYCYIGPGNHRFDDPEKPLIEQGMAEFKGVTIGDNAWIGTRATVLDGVTIGKNAIIGAHSLVTTDVPDNAIAVGTPAKVIRMRN